MAWMWQGQETMLGSAPHAARAATSPPPSATIMMATTTRRETAHRGLPPHCQRCSTQTRASHCLGVGSQERCVHDNHASTRRASAPSAPRAPQPNSLLRIPEEGHCSETTAAEAVRRCPGAGTPGDRVLGCTGDAGMLLTSGMPAVMGAAAQPKGYALRFTRRLRRALAMGKRPASTAWQPGAGMARLPADARATPEGGTAGAVAPRPSGL